MPRPAGSGRKKGTPNKATAVARAFLENLCSDKAVQKVVKDRVLAGETAGFFRAIDKLVPDPPREMKLSGDLRMIQWPDGEDIAEE